jgi:hypothetical protein
MHLEKETENLWMMKKIAVLIISACLFLIIGCKKDDFDLNDPDVEIFVNQLKSGKYDKYEKGNNDENLWLLMPNFSQNHIQSLINFSNDTSHIMAFPVNPLSSRRPFPGGREYFILGECLLWTVEGIRNGSGYGSLDPFLIDTTKNESERYKGLNGNEILIVRDFYKEWWINFKDKDWENKNPLEGSSYRWF